MSKRVKFRATRWITTAAMTLGLGIAVPMAVAPTASATATAGCSGTLIDQINHYDYSVSSHPHVATTYLYWDGTYNCARSVKAGSYYGVSSRMNLDLWSKAGGADNDNGYFSYEAGPVKVYGRNTCINFELDMWKPNGGPNFLQDHVPPSGFFHCG